MIRLAPPSTPPARTTGNTRPRVDGTGIVANYQFYLAHKDYAEKHRKAVEIVLAASNDG